MIHNEVSVHWGVAGTSPTPIFADDRFQIVPIDLQGTLRAFKHDPAGTSFNIEPAQFSHGDATGPFVAAPAPP